MTSKEFVKNRFKEAECKIHYKWYGNFRKKTYYLECKDSDGVICMVEGSLGVKRVEAWNNAAELVAKRIVNKQYPNAKLAVCDGDYWIDNGSGKCISYTKKGKPKYFKTAHAAWIAAALQVESETAKNE